MIINRSKDRMKGWRSRYVDRWLHLIWEKAATPKLWTITICFTYLILITGWIPAIIEPPNSVSSRLGVVSMYIIASMVVVGSVAGLISAFWGIFKVEVWSVVTVAVGILLYWCVVQGLHWYTEGNRLPQAQTVLALIPAFIARFIWVSRKQEADDNELFVHRRTAD